MVLRAYYQTGEEEKLAYTRNVSRAILKVHVTDLHFALWSKVQEAIDRGDHLIFVLPRQDIVQWMEDISPAEWLDDYTHPGSVDDPTYIFGANSMETWIPLLTANQAAVEAYDTASPGKIDFVKIRTANMADPLMGQKPLWGHVCAALVFYDRKLKNVGE